MNITSRTVDDLLQAVGPFSLLHKGLLIRELEAKRRVENDPLTKLKMNFAISHLCWIGEKFDFNANIEVAGDLNAYLLCEQPNFTNLSEGEDYGPW